MKYLSSKWTIYVMIFAVLILFVAIAVPWFSTDKEGFSQNKEGKEILDLKHSDAVANMFMALPAVPPTDMSYIQMSLTPRFDSSGVNWKLTGKYYLPNGWYTISIKENLKGTPLEDTKNPSHMTDYVPRMTMLDPKGSRRESNDLDITSLKNSSTMSSKMNSNSMSSIKDYYANETAQYKISTFLNRASSTDAKTDKATADALKAFVQAEQNPEVDLTKDYDKAKSTQALEALKKAAKKNDKSSAVSDFDGVKLDVSNSLLQYDAAMPAFWEPGSFRNVAKTYIPSYEDSVFLSQSTGLPEFSNIKNRPEQMGGFCSANDSDTVLEDKCNSLDAEVCASTTCCVLLGGSKCVAGNMNGPSVSSNYSDTTIQNRDFYYFQGKCYGNCYQNGASSMYQATKDKVPAKEDAEAASLKADAAASTPSPAASAPTKSSYNVGDTLMAIYSLQGGSSAEFGKEQRYSATVLLVNADTYTIKWNDGPLASQTSDTIQKDTLQKTVPAPAPAPAPATAPR